MVMHIIMDDGARVVGPTQGLLTLDSYPSLHNIDLYKTMIVAYVLNNYPSHYGILRFNTISQQLITDPYLNQTTAANVLDQYCALYENLWFNTISYQIIVEPYLKQMTAAHVLTQIFCLLWNPKFQCYFTMAHHWTLTE